MKSILLKIALLKKTQKLLISLLMALGVFLLTRQHYPVPVFLLLCWIVFAISDLVLSWFSIILLNPKETGIIATKDNDGPRTVFTFIVLAAFVSLFAILYLVTGLDEIKDTHSLSAILLPILSVGCSWLLIHTVFTLWYAHLFYSYQSLQHKKDREHLGGLEFPGEEHPAFMDFAYFSFVLGMTFQVSDVQITSGKIRRLALLHGLLSFVYNTVIVALSINIIYGLIGK